MWFCGFVVLWFVVLWFVVLWFCEYVHYYLCKLLLVLWPHKKSCVQIMMCEIKYAVEKQSVV